MLNRSVRARRLTCAALSVPLVVATRATAIVYRDDVSDALSLGLSNQAQFSGAGIITNGPNTESGTGALIASDWVLTAKHVVTGSSTATFYVGSSKIAGTVYTDPSSDLALIHLSTAAPATAAVIAPNFTATEAGAFVWNVGYGGHSNVSNQGGVT